MYFSVAVVRVYCQSDTGGSSAGAAALLPGGPRPRNYRSSAVAAAPAPCEAGGEVGAETPRAHTLLRLRPGAVRYAPAAQECGSRSRWATFHAHTPCKRDGALSSD